MTIGYSIHGHGPERVIVMHGWLGDHKIFSPMFPVLDKDRFTYAFVDYRGYGQSRGMSGDYTMQELARDALHLADSLRWWEFHLVGHSMGGMAIQRIMRDAPDRVRSAVAITAVPACGSSMDENGRALFTRAIESDEARRAIINATTGSRLSDVWLDLMVAQCRANTTVEAFAGYLQAFTTTDFSEDIKGNTTPLLVLAGEHDAALTEQVMQRTFMAWYPRARLKLLSNAGHYPMQEVPVHLVSVIEAFLHEHKKQSRYRRSGQTDLGVGK